MTTRDVSLGALLSRTFALMASDAGAVLLAYGTIVGASTALDLATPNGGNFATLPIMVVQYYMVRRLIDHQNLRSAERHAGFGSYFLLGVITGLPTLLGFVALVIPGFYLGARWAMSGAALLAENDGATNAARRSWHGSAGHTLPIAMAQLVLAIPLIVGMVAIVGVGVSNGIAAANGGGEPSSATMAVVSLAFNAMLYASQIAGWYFGVAAYELIIGQPTNTLTEVFA